MPLHVLQEIFNKEVLIAEQKKELFFRCFKVDSFKTLDHNASFFGSNKYLAVRFDTYFGMFSIQKWIKYSRAEHFYCKAKISGCFEINIYSLSEHNSETLLTSRYNDSGVFDNMIEIPATTDPFVFIELRYVEQPDISELFWASECDEINDIRLCIGICTFKKEKYVYTNMSNFRHFFNMYPELLEHINIIVSDNGKSLDVSKINLPNVEVYPNDNLGGSGGYGRVMIEACQKHPDFTHLFLMDDDVEFLGTSLFLAYNFLTHLREDYLDRCLECMNFNIDYPNMLSVGMEYMDKSGNRGILDKNAIDRNDLIHMSINTYNKNQYGGWWGSIIPHKFINVNNLPLPLFFQLDDIEFAFRNKLKYVMLNGFCVWHEGFYKKIQASKLFFGFRNWLIANPLQNIMSIKVLKHNYFNDFIKALTQFDYDEAQCMLNAYEDFLKGPDFIFNRENTFASLKRALSLNEKFKPFYSKSELCLEDTNYLELCNVRKLHGIKRILFKFTFNGHLFPLPRRHKDTYSVYDCLNRRAFYRNTMVTVINPHYKTYAVREFDYRRGLQLILKWYYLRFVGVFKEKQVIAEYKNKYKYVTSFEFWKKYLNI